MNVRLRINLIIKFFQSVYVFEITSQGLVTDRQFRSKPPRPSGHLPSIHLVEQWDTYYRQFYTDIRAGSCFHFPTRSRHGPIYLHKAVVPGERWRSAHSPNSYEVWRTQSEFAGCVVCTVLSSALARKQFLELIKFWHLNANYCDKFWHRSNTQKYLSSSFLMITVHTCKTDNQM